MNISKPRRIGLFCHSMNPRGGVMHAMELGEALAALGYEVTLHAPSVDGQRFPRPLSIRTAPVPARRAGPDLPQLVFQRIEEYLRYLRPRGQEFDVYHAHDGISASALADLAAEGTIRGYIRTVHHLEDYGDDALQKANERSIRAATTCVCVSRLWRDELLRRYGIEAAVVGNGVNSERFSSARGPDDMTVRAELIGDRPGPVFLAVGGIEERKNTLNLLRAFLSIRAKSDEGTLLIIGGVSLLDHSHYRRQFDEELLRAGPAAVKSVVIAGRMPEEKMPPVYRAADALVFPSVCEGFGLAVLEAMACGTPVITSSIAPFTEYLSDREALLVDPRSPQSIARAMRRMIEETTARDDYRAAGLAAARRFPWSAVARAHQRAYQQQEHFSGESQYAGNAV